MDGHNYPTSWAAIVLLAMIVYVASYATGLGNVPWQQGELFALDGECATSNRLVRCDSDVLTAHPYFTIQFEASAHHSQYVFAHGPG